MLFSFRDIDNAALYTKSRVIVITGQHLLFNRLLVDRIRNSVKEDDDLSIKSSSMMQEFFGSTEDEVDINDVSRGSIDIDTFFKVINTKSLNGRWYCCSQYQSLSKKQKEKIKTYIKKPNENGMLVFVASEWEDIKELRKLQSLKSSQFSHIVDLGYPSREQLLSIVSNLFRNNGKNVGEMAVKLFVMRMSTAYDEYEETIQLVCNNMADKKDINYVDMKEAMKGIENFIMDDFVKALLKPINSIKVVKTRKIYKIWDSLSAELEPYEIVKKLKYKIKDLIEFRLQINNGNIPVKGRYNVEKIKKRIPEENRVQKASNMAFKRNAYISSMTSVGDWLYMYSILDKINAGASQTECVHAIIALMHRRIMSNDRLMNEMSVKNTLDEGLVDINELFYTNGWQALRKVSSADINNIESIGSKAVDTETGEIIEIGGN